MGLIEPELHISGYDSCSSSLLNSAVANITSWLWNILKTRGGRPSRPSALFFFRAFKAALTSISSIGSSRIGTVCELETDSEGLITLSLDLLSGRDLKYSPKTSTEIGISSPPDWSDILLISLQNSRGLFDLNSLSSLCKNATDACFFFLIRALYVFLSDQKLFWVSSLLGLFLSSFAQFLNLFLVALQSSSNHALRGNLLIFDGFFFRFPDVSPIDSCNRRVNLYTHSCSCWSVRQFRFQSF